MSLLRVVGNKHPIDHIYAWAIQDIQESTPTKVQKLKLQDSASSLEDVTFESYDNTANIVYVVKVSGERIAVNMDDTNSTYKLFVDSPESECHKATITALNRIIFTFLNDADKLKQFTKPKLKVFGKYTPDESKQLTNYENLSKHLRKLYSFKLFELRDGEIAKKLDIILMSMMVNSNIVFEKGTESTSGVRSAHGVPQIFSGFVPLDMTSMVSSAATFVGRKASNVVTRVTTDCMRVISDLVKYLGDNGFITKYTYTHDMDTRLHQQTMLTVHPKKTMDGGKKSRKSRRNRLPKRVTKRHKNHKKRTHRRHR
jgi:predicted nucleic acid-binding OB-fold protein